MSSPALSFAPGTLVGDRYRIEALIGEGGFGAVFRAVQLALDRPVALKVMLPDLLANDGLARFQREAELGQRLEHPNTVRLLDFGRAGDGSPYLVFELLKGQTLERAIHDAGRLPVPRVRRVATQLLKALMEAHSLGIVHRDLKPANVFLCNFQGEADFVKVLDFGIAKGGGLRPLTQRGQVVGTPAYMAPEQVMGREATFVSDLYALGLLMSEALAGAPVFQGASGVEIAREQMSASPVPHGPEVVRSPLGRVILRATQKQPERRYASAAEMLADLEATVGEPSPGVGAALLSSPSAGLAYALTSPPSAPAPLVPALPRRPLKQSGPPWVVLGVAVAGVAALAVTLALVLPDTAGTPAAPARTVAPRRAPSAAAARVPLSEMTSRIIMERVQDAGYEVTNNSTTDSGSITTASVGVSKSSRTGFLTLYRCKDAESARSIEDSFKRTSVYAVARDGGVVLAAMLNNGTDPGNEGSRRLLAAVVH